MTDQEMFDAAVRSAKAAQQPEPELGSEPELGHDPLFDEAVRHAKAKSPVEEQARAAVGEMASDFARTSGFITGAEQKVKDMVSGTAAVGKALGQMAPKFLPRVDPREDREAFTDEEKQILSKYVVPTLGQIGTAVYTGATHRGGIKGAIGRGALNLLAAPAFRTLGRTLAGEGTTPGDLGEDLSYGVLPGTVTALQELPAIARLTTAIPAGEAGRRMRGEPTTIFDVFMDSLQPGILSAEGGIGRGIRNARERPMSDLPGYRGGDLPLEESLYPFGHREITGRGDVARIVPQEESLVEKLRKLFASPMTGAEKSTRPEFDELRRRWEHFTFEGGQEFAPALARARDKVKAIEDALKAQGVDTNQASLLTEFPGQFDMPGYAPAMLTPGLSDLSRAQREFFDALGMVEDRVGMFTPDAPQLENFGGSLILNPAAHAAEQQATVLGSKTLARFLQPESAMRRRMQAFQRGGSYAPSRNIGSPTARIDEYIRQYKDKIRAMASFGNISTGSPSAGVKAVEKLLNQRATPWTGGIGDETAAALGAEPEPPHAWVADKLEELATKAGASKGKGSEELQALADYVRAAYLYGDRRMPEEMAPLLRDLRLISEKQAEPAREFGRYGQDLITRLRQQGVSGSEARTLAGMEDWLKYLYQTPAPGKWDDILGRLGRLQSTMFLSKTGPRQVAQSGMNPMLAGIGNTTEGLTRRLLDPSFSIWQEGTGAGESPMASLLARMRPDREPDLLGKSIGLFEHYNRIPSASGYVPYIEKLLDDINAGVRNRAILRQARELGIDLGEDLTPTSPLMGNLYRRGVGRAQGMWTEPGYSSFAMTGSPGGRAFFAFKPMALGQWRRFRDDVLAPIASGAKPALPRLLGGEGDASELVLGLDRLARAAPTMLGSAAISNALTSAQQLAPEQTGVVNRAIQTTVGMPADIANNLADIQLFAKQRSAWNKARAIEGALGKSIQPPSVSALTGIDPVSSLNAAVTLLNPAWGSAMSLAAPALRTLTKARPAHADDMEAPLERTPLSQPSPVTPPLLPGFTDDGVDYTPPERPSYMPGVRTTPEPAPTYLPGVSTPGLDESLFENLPDYLRRDPFAP